MNVVFKITNEKDGFTYLNCLSESIDNNNFCPYRFKYYYEKECLTECPSGKEILKKEKNGDTIIYRCSSECKNSDGEGENIEEREYKYIDNSQNPNIIYCINKCPKYFNSPTDEEENYLCVSKCDDDFLPYNNNCIEKTQCKVILIEDINQRDFICYKKAGEIFEECPYNYPYLYKQEDNNNIYCLKSCRDTNNENFPFGQIKTYFIEIESKKKCLASYDGYFKDETALKLVNDCKTSVSGPFKNVDECKNNCGEKKYLFDTLECIDDDCKYHNNMVEYNNVCYDECPYNSEKKFSKEGKCQECKNPSDNTPEEIEIGYYLSGGKICYESCNEIDTDKTFYHNKNENICYESTNGCKINPVYKYSKANYDYICYKSCFDIDESYIYEKDFFLLH